MPSDVMALLRRPVVLAVLVIGTLYVAAGCDLTDDQEDLSLLLGSWEVQDLTVDGISVKAQLDAQYDQLVLTLRKGAEEREFFTITGRKKEATESLFVQGTFEVDDNELTLFPDQASPIEFDSVTPDSSGSRLTLSTEEGASEDLFLELIQLPIQGAVDRLEIRLSKGRRASEADPASPER